MKKFEEFIKEMYKDKEFLNYLGEIGVKLGEEIDETDPFYKEIIGLLYWYYYNSREPESFFEKHPTLSKIITIGTAVGLGAGLAAAAVGVTNYEKGKGFDVTHLYQKITTPPTTSNVTLDGNLSAQNITYQGSLNGEVNGMNYTGEINANIENGIINANITANLEGEVDIYVENATIKGEANLTYNGTIHYGNGDVPENGTANGTIDLENFTGHLKGYFRNVTVRGKVNGKVNGRIVGYENGTIRGGKIKGKIDGNLEKIVMNGSMQGKEQTPEVVSEEVQEVVPLYVGLATLSGLVAAFGSRGLFGYSKRKFEKMFMNEKESVLALIEHYVALKRQLIKIENKIGDTKEIENLKNELKGKIEEEGEKIVEYLNTIKSVMGFSNIDWDKLKEDYINRMNALRGILQEYEGKVNEVSKNVKELTGEEVDEEKVNEFVETILKGGEVPPEYLKDNIDIIKYLVGRSKEISEAMGRIKNFYESIRGTIGDLEKTDEGDKEQEKQNTEENMDSVFEMLEEIDKIESGEEKNEE